MPRRRASLKTKLGLAAGVLVVAGVPYWWLSRPEARYVPDNGNLFPITVEGKVGFMAPNGEERIKPQFDETKGFSEGRAAVRIGNKWGYIDETGALAINPQFDDVQDFRYGRATVKLCCGAWYDERPNSRFGIIDADGEYVGSPTFTWIGSSYSGGYLQAKTAEGRLGFADRSGKLAITGDFTSLPDAYFHEGLTPAARGEQWGYLDRRGTWAIEPQFEWASAFSEGLAAVSVGGKTGFIDRSGRFRINPVYEGGASVFREGLATVRVGDKMGLIDARGTMVVAPSFDWITRAGEGLFLVRLDRSWGFADAEGKLVIPAEFDEAGLFQNGLARVKVLGKEAYIRPNGEFVVNPFDGRTIAQQREHLAAEAEKAAKAAAAAERARVEQGIVGNWRGQFGYGSAELVITRQGAGWAGELLNDGWRETLRVSLLDDNRLRLVGIEAVRVERRLFQSGQYSLDTIELALDAERATLAGDFHDTSNSRGRVVMRRQ